MRIPLLLLFFFLSANALGQNAKQSVNKKVEEPTSLEFLFIDKFREDSRHEYESTEKVAWKPGKLILPAKATLKRAFSGGLWTRVDFEFEAINLSVQLPKSELEIQFEFADSKACVVRLSQVFKSDGISSSIELLHSTLSKDGVSKLEVLREASFDGPISNAISLEYRNGVVRVFLKDLASTRLMAFIQGYGRVEAVKVLSLSPSELREFSIMASSRANRIYSDKEKKELALAISKEMIATNLYQNGRFTEALQTYNDALEIQRKALGVKNLDYATTLNNLGELYRTMGNFAKSKSVLNQSLKIKKAFLGENHPDYTATLSNLAVLHMSMGEHSKAEPLLSKCYDIEKAILGVNHPYSVMTLINLAEACQKMGDLSRAEPLMIQCHQISKAVFGEQHRIHAATLNNLGMLYFSIGDLVKAKPLLIQCRSIQRSVLKENHPDYATTINNLASLYRSIGDYDRSEHLYFQCLKIRKRILGEPHPIYAATLGSLAALYQLKGDYSKAEPLLIRCLKIQRGVLKDGHPDYSTTLNNLALLYKSTGNYAKAKPLFIQSLDICKAVYGEKNLEYVTTLNNLAGLYRSTGDLATAESLYLQCHETLEVAVEGEHPYRATTLSNLAKVNVLMGRNLKAESFARQALDSTSDRLNRTSTILSERQQLAMAHVYRHQLDDYISLTLKNPKYREHVVQGILQWKGGTLVRQRNMRMASSDPIISKSFKALQCVVRQLSSLANHKTTKSRRGVKELNYLTDKKEHLEAQLSRQSQDFRSAIEPVSIGQIQQTIPENGLLIDYFQFVHSQVNEEKKGEFNRTNSILAIILKRQGEPNLIYLGSIESLRAEIEKWRKTKGVSPNSRLAGEAIRKQIWEPLAKYTVDAETVLVSPDGVLGQLPFIALPGKHDGTYLIEDHRIVIIPAPRLLPSLVKERSETYTNKVLLIGGVDYGLNEDGKATPWSPLGGAKAEIKALQKQFDRAPEDLVIAVLEGSESTEKRVFENLPGARIQHFATHGLFESERVKISSMLPSGTGASRGASRIFGQVEQDGMVTLTRSALVLAGANRPLPIDNKSETETHDGLLMDSEILMLPLQNTELVVLSACDTGLGKIEGGEGVLGIQRAFHVAGVQTTVASLWKVDDWATKRLMLQFHKNLAKPSTSKIDALRNAQLQMLRDNHTTHVERGATRELNKGRSAQSPFFWAAFQLSGDWR